MAAKALADELGPRAVRVNSVLPGRMEPEAAPGRTAGTARRRGGRPPGRIPLQRPGEPLEFARPAVFLLSPAAGYVTGTMLAVDGGTTRTL